MVENSTPPYINYIIRLLYIAVCLITPIIIARKETTVLINTGAKVYIIIVKLADKLRLFVLHIFSVIMTNTTKKMQKFAKLYKNVSIKIGKIIHKVSI